MTSENRDIENDNNDDNNNNGDNGNDRDNSNDRDNNKMFIFGFPIIILLAVIIAYFVIIAFGLLSVTIIFPSHDIETGCPGNMTKCSYFECSSNTTYLRSKRR